jgi:hypothetical protein
LEPVQDIPTLVKRRLQAQVVGPIYEEMVREVGKEKAAAILDAAIRKAAISEGREFAARAPGSKRSMENFIALYELWTRDGALEVDLLQASDTKFDFNVRRCRYAEMYKEMGLGEVGPLLSCNRDGTFCEGYDPNITLRRDQTIMEGAPCCTFRYSYSDRARGSLAPEVKKAAP